MSVTWMFSPFWLLVAVILLALLAVFAMALLARYIAGRIHHQGYQEGYRAAAYLSLLKLGKQVEECEAIRASRRDAA